MLAFVDLETTGLNPDKHEVLEVACIITDDDLREIARFESVIFTTTEFHELDEFIRDMHTKNELWAAVQTAQPSWQGLKSVDEDLARFIEEHAVSVKTDAKGRKVIERPQLAGNTISFDRAFMKKHLPRAEAQLHYRNVDISSLNELARRFWPTVHDGRPRVGDAAHRAMADCDDSLKCARYYSKALAAVIPAAADRGAHALTVPAGTLEFEERADGSLLVSVELPDASAIGGRQRIACGVPRDQRSALHPQPTLTAIATVTKAYINWAQERT